VAAEGDVTNHVLSDLVERITGLALDRGGVHKALDRFVTDRMQLLDVRRLEDYTALAADPAGAEQQLLIEAITVQHTWFYRDAEQLKTIEGLLAAARPGPLSVWVAGCATGEEAYTLAIIGRRIGRELSVLATDVNQTALEIARRGAYSAAAVRDVPEIEKRWLPLINGSHVVDPTLRRHVTFVRHNLVEPPPIAPRGGWDLIVCRNVLIYFSPTAAIRLLERFARAVREGGSLVVGASEVVFEPPPGLELVSSANRLVLRRPMRSYPPILPRTPTAPKRATTETSEPPPPPRKRAQDAAPAIETLPTVREEDLVTGLLRGHALLERGDIAAAIPVYAELAVRFPVEAEVRLFLGIAHHAHREFDAAVKELRACLCLAPSLWPAGFYLARTYEELGRRAEALQQYDLIAVDDLGIVRMKSKSATMNEMNALRGDYRDAARRVSADRGVSLRRLIK
jgi:chemotaxis protein methyltransferase CheR